MRLIPIVNGNRQQAVRFTVAQAAKVFAQAHRDGETWDVRVATTGQGYRLATEAEAAEVVEAVTAELQKEQQ